MINMVTFTLSVLLNAIKRFRAGDYVLVVTNPPTIPLVVLLACHLRKAKCILNVHDIYPEVLVATGTSQRNSVFTRTIEWITRGLYGQMYRIVVLGRDMASIAQLKLPAGDRRVIIIPNWADLDLITPVKRESNSLLSQLGLTQKFVIQFSGNIGRTHGIEHLAMCAEQFRDDPTVHFLFIGFGGKKAWLEQAAKEKDLTNITIIDYRPRSDLPISLNACDVAIISFVKGMAGVSVPSRMYNIMAAGKPIIAMADANSELAQVISEEDIGWTVEPGDVDRLCSVICEARNSPELLAAMGKRARKAVETKYSFESISQAYLDLVRSLS
jgi:glycosyltransferase involved in cell wall biosynthesis